MGFKLETSKTVTATKCEVIISSKYLIPAILNTKDLNIKRINECLLLNKKIQNVLFKFKKINLWLNKNELDKIKEIHSLIESKNSAYKSILNNKLDINFKKISPAEKSKVYLLLSKLEKNKSLLSKIKQIYLYQKLEFFGKVESIINSIISGEYIESFFIENHSDLISGDVNTNILKMLIAIKEDIQDQKLFDSLLFSISFNVNESLRDLIVNEFDIPNKLSFVQQRIKSVHYGTRLPFVWSNWIEKFSSTEELKMYLEKGDVYQQISKDPKYLSVLLSYFPKEKNKREVLISSYLKIKDSINPYLKDLSLRLMMNDQFSNELTNRKFKTKKPFFIQKRNFYRQLLQENKAILYSAYNLIKIGDIKRDYLISILAVKSYGL
jgi:hypothetical protein